MKATILLENLQKSLSFVNHGVSARATMPSLLNFLIKAKEGYLEIQATDLEIGISTKVPGKIDEEGEVSVSAKTLFDLVSNLSGDKIVLETKEQGLLVSSQSAKTNLPVTPTADFPALYEKKGEKLGVIEKELLDKELSRIVFSSSQDMGRPNLSGALIKKEEEGLTIVATDGFRLSLREKLKLSLSSEIDAPLLVPARLLREVVSFKPEEDTLEVYVSKESSQIIFEDSRTTLVGRLIDAEYPDYEKILPSDFSVRVIFDKEEAQAAVRVCSIFAREAANVIRISIEKDKVVFSASAPSVGENHVDVAAKVDGEENQIAFNSKYLLDFFGTIDSSEVSFEMSGPLSPGVFKLPEEKNYLHLIMPIKIQE
jgi:DNA polymerase-3 subunit beta